MAETDYNALVNYMRMLGAPQQQLAMADDDILGGKPVKPILPAVGPPATPAVPNTMQRQYPGAYINPKTGVRIERSDAGGWNVINPETGRVLDNLPTLKRAREIYE